MSRLTPNVTQAPRVPEARLGVTVCSTSTHGTFMPRGALSGPHGCPDVLTLRD